MDLDKRASKATTHSMIQSQSMQTYTAKQLERFSSIKQGDVALEPMLNGDKECQN